jgi:hypothetical protein
LITSGRHGRRVGTGQTVHVIKLKLSKNDLPKLVMPDIAGTPPGAVGRPPWQARKRIGRACGVLLHGGHRFNFSTSTTPLHARFASGGVTFGFFSLAFEPFLVAGFFYRAGNLVRHPRIR